MLIVELTLRKDHDDARLVDIRSFLRAHNLELNPAFMLEAEVSPPVPLVVIASTNREVAGGLIADTRGRWLKVSIMAVRADLRRQGIATQVLQAAESEAIARGCERSCVETMEFQGPQFYEARGYTQQCKLDDWDSHGHAKHIYVKDLTSVSR